MKIYRDLLESEVSEILSESNNNAYIYTNNGNTSYRKTDCVNYYGIPAHENNMYIRYDFGRRSAVVPVSFIVARLAHENFYID